MDYGVIAAGTNVNAAIHRCFEFIPESETRRFVKWFREQPHDETQVMHTFRELVVGAYLGSQGMSVRASPNIAGKTPDWYISENIVLEVLTLHASKELEDDINRQLKAKGIASYWAPDNTKRLFDRIRDKATAYQNILGNRPYVVAVFGEIQVDIEMRELHDCVFDKYNLFANCPHLTGVVLFVERNAVYSFKYVPNPTATNPFDFPEGKLDLRVSV
jgi:hypothetical protein